MIISIYRSIYSCIESNQIVSYNFSRYRQIAYRWVWKSISYWIVMNHPIYTLYIYHWYSLLWGPLCTCRRQYFILECNPEVQEIWSGPAVVPSHVLMHSAEFSSNPNQTHLRMLIRVFKIIRKLQVDEFDQGWSWTLQQIGPPGKYLRNHGVVCSHWKFLQGKVPGCCT